MSYVFQNTHHMMVFCFLDLKEEKGDEAYRMVSNGQLNVLLHLYRHPINVVVFHDSKGDLVLGGAWRLDAFSAYPDRT